MSLAVATEANTAMRGVVRLALQDLERTLRPLRGASAETVRDALLEYLPELSSKWGDAAAVVAADFYEAARLEAGLGTGFLTELADVNVARVEPLARWAVDPLFEASPSFDAMSSLLAGGFQRLVMDTNRDTTQLNLDRDDAAVGYARHASASACTFCRLMASRGAVYTSEESARYVTGVSLGGQDYRAIARGASRESRVAGVRASTQARSGRRMRRSAKRPVGHRYHDDCHCTVVPVFADRPYEEAPYVQAWRDSYSDVGVSNSLTQTLSAMRADMGSR